MNLISRRITAYVAVVAILGLIQAVNSEPRPAVRDPITFYAVKIIKFSIKCVLKSI